MTEMREKEEIFDTVWGKRRRGKTIKEKEGREKEWLNGEIREKIDRRMQKGKK